MKGIELIDIIQNSIYLQHSDIKETLKELLKKKLINPSTLIDAQVELLEEEKYRLRCHFEDSVVSTIQLFGGHYKGKLYKDAKKRLFYNTSFSKQFPNIIFPEPLTEEDKKYWSDFFNTIYGFRPEEE